MTSEQLEAMAAARLARQFTSFAMVGVLGFAIDGGLFLLLTNTWNLPVHWARGVSALSSLTTTWALNRRTTFADQSSGDARSEYARYVLAQLVGLTVNLGVFALSLVAIPPLKRYPVIALLLGATAALLVNFWTARKFAFRRDQPAGR